MSLPFTKMHGLGNDFVVVDGRADPKLLITPEKARKLCDRRFGVGADQLLWLVPPRGVGADARVEIFNADGSIAEMCGNGIRCAALFVERRGAKPDRVYRFETLAGLIEIHAVSGGYRVNMGAPALGKAFTKGEALSLVGGELRFHEISTGPPHAVVFVDHVKDIPLESIGPTVETHSRFPKRTNVDFVEVTGPSTLRVRVWERGAGATLACGTGACAAAAAAVALGKAKSPVTVSLPGGELRIEWEGPGKPIFMTGPAAIVFEGEFLAVR